ncbi:tRNA (N6-threonylcarbamoyladenosine(37)-N6)-methyltransferase TrmO [Roseomonas sp. CAU 1739]
MNRAEETACMDWNATRPGEVEGDMPERADAAITFIGRIRTPFAARADCPHRGSLDGPVCTIEVDAPWRPALRGIEAGARLEVLYWMHLARRDLLVQAPKGRPAPLGTFALRSPNRPNPISSSEVEVVAVTAEAVMVRGLDCVDGTPLVDIKALRR